MTLSQLKERRRMLAELMAESAPESPRPEDLQAFAETCEQIRQLARARK